MQTFKRFGIQAKGNNYQEAPVYGIACVYALMEKRISEYLRPYNLTVAKFNALMIVKHSGKDKGMSQVEIGRRLIVTASNMTRLLDNLEKDAYILRFSREGDRRVKLIKISEKGSALLDRAWPGYCEKISEIANVLNKEDRRYLTGIIGKWCDRLAGGLNA